MSVEIIAEAAQGYLGDPPAKTRLLVDCAAAAQADIVKFQLVYADEICTADHQHFDLFRQLEMPDADWRMVAERARSRDIGLFLDVFGDRSLDLACRIGADGVKLHSTDLLNVALMRHVAASPVRRVVLSAGGTFDGELSAAVGILREKRLVLMHGFQGYPTRADENQLARLERLRRAYPQCEIGFADHVSEDEPERLWLSAVAIGAGATVIEKHITPARALKEEDHESALNVDDFRAFAAAMRLASAALGTMSNEEDFGMTQAEVAYRHKMKKQVVAASDLEPGATLSAAQLMLRRTSAEGEICRDLAAVEGRRLRRAVSKGQAIRPEDLA
jgi:N,N'-diacetyllegionaminate synthase